MFASENNNYPSNGIQRATYILYMHNTESLPPATIVVPVYIPTR